MSIDSQYIVPIASQAHRYPISHWGELSRFITGDERDPRNLFNLAADVWDAWPYAAHGYSSKPGKFRFHFERLNSFLKPYVKWYCYQRLLADNGKLSRAVTIFPGLLIRADDYLIEHHYDSPDDITSTSSFKALWEAQLLPQEHNDGAESRSTVRLQARTHAFWRRLQGQFEFPQVVPPVAPHERYRLTESSFDEHQVIPMPVIKQLGNQLALHREGREKLNRFHHLRLCVLMLTFALGRRIDEILTAPRGTGEKGPLAYYPAKGSGPKGALWFHFSPNKHGPNNRVHVSKKWEEVVTYCVSELIRYSDEIRASALPEVREFLILTSHWNLTNGPNASLAPPVEEIGDFRFSGEGANTRQRKRQIRKEAVPLSYDALHMWLHGHSVGGGNKPLGKTPGILSKWGITANGLANSEIYQLRTHQARHTRQSAIASDPQVSPLSRQRDLNHVDRNMQTHYQHNGRQQNEIILQKAKDGQLVGPAMEWFSTLFGAGYQGSEREARFRPGLPQPLPPRWRNLIQNNPQFMQFSMVPCGYCALPQGPGACEEYMNCTDAEEGGCRWFLTNPEDAGMLIQITQTVRRHRQKEQESIKAGREVQAEKYHALASRSASLEKEALSHCDIEALPNCSQDLKDRLKARYLEIKEEAQIDEHTIHAYQVLSSEMDVHEHGDRETSPMEGQSVKDHLKARMREMKGEGL